MNEIERRTYLEAMGVEVFYLKEPIAYARRSPNYVIPAGSLDTLAATIELPPNGAAVTADSGQSRENARSELAKIRSRLQAPAALKEEGLPESVVVPAKEVTREIVPQVENFAPAEAPDAGTDALQFKLSYFVVNGTVAILDEQPYAQTGNSDRDRLGLLRNILTALEVDYSQCDFRAETIVWPLEAEMEFDESPDKAAEQILRGFIAQKHHSHKFQHLIAFAGSLEALLEENKSSLEAGFSMIITSSLSAMLAYPELKRQVWQQLKPLIPMLAKP